MIRLSRVGEPGAVEELFPRRLSFRNTFPGECQAGPHPAPAAPPRPAPAAPSPGAARSSG
ncbi:hypothetical protein FNV66_51805 [Streptomyces sp. S1D4-14]|nr:hypothetical protein FNV67_52955 [Streptomyces sp. S1D4-20]QDN72817.1 hypothetical protein FNV66_51805 [Streptomyces sp. S1D4-14]QDO55344.1 hypothetical protein FNV60_50690 [Streptomyces sp. RLB3-5]QDO65520.1 hypothetical protein FNV59_52530 [Streptomyces sp. RLB1-8]